VADRLAEEPQWAYHGNLDSDNANQIDMDLDAAPINTDSTNDDQPDIGMHDVDSTSNVAFAVYVCLITHLCFS
jgi:hypothetical protein